MDIECQVEDRVTTCNGMTIDVLVMDAVCQRTADTIIRCRIIGLTVSSVLTTDKQHTFPLESVVFAEIFLHVEIVDRCDYQMKRIDRVAAAAFASRAGGSETTVIIEVLTRLVGRDNNLRMLGPNERIVLTNQRVLNREMVRGFDNQMEVESRVTMILCIIMTLIVPCSACSLIPLSFPLKRVVVADIERIEMLVTGAHGHRQLIDGVADRQFDGLQAVEDMGGRLFETDIERISALPFATHNNSVAPMDRVIVTDGAIGPEQIGVHQGQFETIDTITTVHGVYLVLVVVVEIKGRVTVFQILELLIQERTIRHTVPFVGLVGRHHMFVHFEERFEVLQFQCID